MTARRSSSAMKARAIRRGAALARPELRRDDGIARAFTASPFGAAIKREDPATRALIEAALARRASAQTACPLPSPPPQAGEGTRGRP